MSITSERNFTIEYGQYPKGYPQKHEVVFTQSFEDENETYAAFVRALHLLYRESCDGISFPAFLNQGVKHLHDILEISRKADTSDIFLMFLMHSYCIESVFFRSEGQNTIETIRVYKN